MCVTVKVLEVSVGWKFKCWCSYDSVRKKDCQGKFEYLARMCAQFFGSYVNILSHVW